MDLGALSERLPTDILTRIIHEKNQLEEKDVIDFFKTQMKFVRTYGSSSYSWMFIVLKSPEEQLKKYVKLSENDPTYTVETRRIYRLVAEWLAKGKRTLYLPENRRGIYYYMNNNRFDWFAVDAYLKLTIGQDDALTIDTGKQPKELHNNSFLKAIDILDPTRELIADKISLHEFADIVKKLGSHATVRTLFGYQYDHYMYTLPENRERVIQMVDAFKSWLYPLGGGSVRQKRNVQVNVKVRVLGRERIVIKQGRKSFVKVKGVLIPLVEARKMEKPR